MKRDEQGRKLHKEELRTPRDEGEENRKPNNGKCNKRNEKVSRKGDTNNENSKKTN